MKILKYIPLFLAAVGVLSSCDKHEIEFPMTNVNEMTQVQLHYFVPVSTATANNIYKIELGDQVYVQPNNASIMSTNNGQPSGSVGLFYTVKETNPVLRYYLGPEQKLAYERKLNLIPGRKQNVIVYDFDKDPLIIDTGYSSNNITFDVTPTYETDSIGYVRFYNLLYETPGVPYQGKIQYQAHYRSRWLNNDWTEWENVGEPVAFGECTSWSSVKIDQPHGADYGRINVYYRILDENGDELQVMGQNGKYSNYSDYWQLQAGRRYQHFFRGYRSDATIRAGVSQWTQL
ncbi:MAG: hypothetical protein K2J42_11015 [Muribaculaceae bacterium]|nr:hypothetical protein [Muribaculaceae bacterium]